MGIESGKCLLLPGDDISPNKLTMLNLAQDEEHIERAGAYG